MKIKICIVVANYYPDISRELLNGTKYLLNKNKKIQYKVIYAPGIFEIPFIISKNINKYDGFIALGCVVKGQTSHFELITKATTYSIMDLSIKYKKPIGNGIISCFNKKQAKERSSLLKKNKGREAAKAIISVLGL
tara:strand:+ start:368 stop:775 length:408 start_codon:yes stop_codon:yes gene_type:complete